MRKTVRILLILIFAAALVYSLTRIVLLAREYKQADEIYEQSRAEHFHVAPSPTPQAGDDAPEPSEEPEEYFPDAWADIEALQAVNPEVLGWLWIPGTQVSFPLLHGEDNAKYLTRSYDLQHTPSGSIFMDYRSPADFTGDNTVIYGHNMNNGGMFGRLKDFGDLDYLEERPYAYVFTAERVLKYRLFTAYKTESTSESYTLDFAEAETDFDAFLAYIAASAGENLTELPEEATPLLTLSTCTSARQTERFVVHGVLAAEKALDS